MQLTLFLKLSWAGPRDEICPSATRLDKDTNTPALLELWMPRLAARPLLGRLFFPMAGGCDQWTLKFRALGSNSKLRLGSQTSHLPLCPQPLQPHTGMLI